MGNSEGRPLVERLTQLLTAVAAIGDSAPQLTERRSNILAVLADATQSHSGFWSWGRGTPRTETVVPVAIIDFGMDDAQRLGLMAFGTSPEMKEAFHSLILKRMGTSSHIATIRQQIFEDLDWQNDNYLRVQMNSCGWDEWLHCVRYSVRDTWSALLLLRNCDSPPFTDVDRQLAEITITSLPWLHSTSDDAIPSESLIGLTPRQRTVMFMLLDGIPRKSIAGALGISEDTVGDHIKAIYSQFKVKSAIELAAWFLRSR